MPAVSPAFIDPSSPPKERMAISILPAITGPNSTVDTTLPHVLLVLDQFPKTLGGGERMVLRLAALLPKYGYRASILTFFIHPECDLRTAAPCPIYVLPLARTYDLNAIKAAVRFRRFLKLQRIQLVQTFFESSDIWAGAVTKVVSSAKLIWSRRDMGILRTFKHRIAYRLLAGIPDAVFSVSEQVRRHCIDVDRIHAAVVHVIYNGLDLSDGNFDERSKGRDKIRVVTVGNIRRVKGHDVFIQAAAAVVKHYPEAFFSIAGEVLEPGYFSELQALVHRWHLGEHFQFAGGVADISQHLSGADIFVLPSRSEGFSNAIVEAMAANLPVIATDVGGNAEAVQDGVTGFIVPPEDPDALATSIMRLLSDPSQAAAMGMAGRARAREMFTTEAMMERTVAVYKELLA